MEGAEHPRWEEGVLVDRTAGMDRIDHYGNREQPRVGRWRGGIKRNVPAILTVPYGQNVFELLYVSSLQQV